MTSRNFGTQSRAFFRVAGRKTGENRWIRALYKGSSITMASVSRVLRVLWLEVTGLLFLALAVVGGAATVREYHRYTAGASGAGKVLLAAVFAVGFLYFGISSFATSRRKSRK